MKKILLLSAAVVLLNAFQAHAQHVLNWANSIGGTGHDDLSVGYTDINGNFYVAGYFFSPTIDIDPGAGNTTLTNLGALDAFVARYAPNGDLQWSIPVLGTGNQYVHDITGDATGIYICGRYQGTVDFDPSTGTSLLTTTAVGAYAAKYDLLGALVWVKSIGDGAFYTTAFALTISGANLTIVGDIAGTGDLNPDIGTANVTSVGGSNEDGFVLLLSTSVGQYQDSRSWGGAAADHAFDVCYQGTDMIISGAFSGTSDFNPDPVLTDFITSNGFNNGYILLEHVGFTYGWTTSMNAANTDLTIVAPSSISTEFYAAGNGRAINMTVTGSTLLTISILGVNFMSILPNPNGEIILGGSTGGNIDFDSGSPLALSHDGSFIASYTNSGGLIYAKFFPQGGGVRSLTFDNNGGVYACGYFYYTTDFDTGPGFDTLTPASPNLGDIFMIDLGGCNSGIGSETITLCDGDTIYLDQLLIAVEDFGSGTPQVVNVTANAVVGNNGLTIAHLHTGANGCDTMIWTTINASMPSASSQTLTLCSGASITVGVNTYTTSGTYVDVIPNAAGCDSTVTTNLTVNSVDTSLTVTTFSLSSPAVGATYQWINCTTGQTIPGATNSSYSPTANGNYGVIVTQNSCSDTSSCYSFVQVGLVEVGALSFTAYPNPSTGTLNVSSQELMLLVRVKDLIGRTVAEVLTESTYTTIDISAYAAGSYVIEVQTASGTSKQLITKE